MSGCWHPHCSVLKSSSLVMNLNIIPSDESRIFGFYVNDSGSMLVRYKNEIIAGLRRHDRRTLGIARIEFSMEITVLRTALTMRRRPLCKYSTSTRRLELQMRLNLPLPQSASIFLHFLLCKIVDLRRYC